VKDNDELSKLRRAALNLLARRDHSVHELIQKLKNRAYSVSSAQMIVEELLQAGYINESRFTENYIHWRSGKGYGPLRISAELQSRGILPEMIAEHLQITDNAWFALAQKIWQKQFKGKLPDDLKLRARQIRFLQYRGFTREQIENVIKI